MLEKITQHEINERSVSSMAVRPNDRSSYGSGGLDAAQVKARFDALSLLLIARYNALIDEIRGYGESGISAEIQTSIEDKTLEDIFRDIESGALAGYLKAYSNEGELFDIQSIVNELYELASGAQTTADEALSRPCVDEEARSGANLAKQEADDAKSVAISAKETADRALALAGQGGGGGDPAVPPTGGEAVDPVARSRADEAYNLADIASEKAYLAQLAADNAVSMASTAYDAANDAYGNAENIRNLALKAPNHTNYIGFVDSTEVAVENGDIVPAYNVTGLLDYNVLYYIAVDYAYSNGEAIVLYEPDGSYAISTDTCGVHLREYYDGESAYLIWEDASGNWCSFPRDDHTCLQFYRIG